MNFSTDQIRLVYKDAKTQFRVPKLSEKCPLEVERAYLVPKTRSESQPYGLRITLTQIREERLGDISHEDAIREGHRTKSEFLATWRETNADNHLDPNCEGEDLIVWVVTFKRGDWTDSPRFLRARYVNHDDYTSNPALAARGEPEVLSEHLLNLYTYEARVRDKQRRGEPVEASVLRIQDELEHLRAQAGSRSQEKRLASIERILQAYKAAA